MTYFSHYPMQKAIFQRLSNDSALALLIKGLFNRPSQGQEYPYITIGESTVTDWSTKTSDGTEQRLEINVWSREGGSKEIELIADRVIALLHQADFAVDGQTLVSIRFSSSAITLENDGFTYQGSLIFRALLEAI